MSATRNGAVYLAFGRPYLAMALASMESLRNSNPGIPVCVLTNVSVSPPDVPIWNDSTDTWIHLDRPAEDNRIFKTSIIDHSPFDKTLFLDCDTLVLRDLDLCWTFLDHFDLCMAMKARPQEKEGKGDRAVLGGKALVNELPHWNSGVIMFRRNDATVEFFASWRHWFATHKVPVDQVSLVDAVFNTDCRLLSLDNRWNRQIDPSRVLDDSIRIVHYTPRIDKATASRILFYDRRIVADGRHSDGGDSTGAFIDRSNARARKRAGRNAAKLWRFIRALRKLLPMGGM